MVIATDHGKLLNASLWVSQVLLFGALCAGGVMKLFMPVAKLSVIFEWTGQVPLPFFRFIGIVDLAGGLGILLPELTGIYPGLTLWAAIGGTLLQLLAIGYHVSRGEAKETPFNFFMLALTVFVLWGRR